MPGAPGSYPGGAPGPYPGGVPGPFRGGAPGPLPGAAPSASSGGAPGRFSGGGTGLPHGLGAGGGKAPGAGARPWPPGCSGKCSLGSWDGFSAGCSEELSGRGLWSAGRARSSLVIMAACLTQPFLFHHLPQLPIVVAALSGDGARGGLPGPGNLHSALGRAASQQPRGETRSAQRGTIPHAQTAGCEAAGGAGIGHGNQPAGPAGRVRRRRLRSTGGRGRRGPGQRRRTGTGR